MDTLSHRTVERPKPETVFGFWIYIMTDCMLFAALFAVFAVLRTAYAGGPTGRALFDLPSILGETGLLLCSSTSCGFAMLSAHRRHLRPTLLWLGVTFCLGAGFVGMEIHDFVTMLGEHAGPDRSAFLSAFFTLVGTHGLHVSIGLLWLAVLAGDMLFVRRALDDRLLDRLVAFSLFWHFLDIVWICIFTFVYLAGSMR